MFNLFCIFSDDTLRIGIDGYFQDMQMFVTMSASLWVTVVALIIFNVWVRWATYISMSKQKFLQMFKSFLTLDPHYLYSLKASCLSRMLIQIAQFPKRTWVLPSVELQILAEDICSNLQYS